MEESQFNHEEGTSYKICEQTSEINEPSLDRDEPSTSSKKSPSRNEESQSSAEDIR